jgi:hypothetical protein
VADRQRQRQRSTPAKPVGAALAERLAARRPEIEEAILARVFSVSDPAASPDPAYLDGLRKAVLSALSYAIAAIEGQSPEPGPIPTELLAQARQAARNGISLATVLRRYFAGYTLLSDFLIGEAEAGDLLGAEELQRLSRAQAELFDHVIDAVANEHRSESEAKSRSRHQRRAECVKRLLAGELADTSELDYDLHGWHLGVVANGAGTEEAIRELAVSLDRRLLAIPQGEGTLWAWLGGRRKVEAAEMEQIAKAAWPAQVSVAIGEPGKGVAGWRLTHRQAVVALPIALRGSEPQVRYSEVAMLAAMLQDEVLVVSLAELYLAPLEKGRDGGRALVGTLRAYFAAERNSASAAAALGVTRQTVNNRLRTIGERFGRPLGACALELEMALRLNEQPKSLKPDSVAGFPPDKFGS